LSTKIHATTDAQGNPTGFYLSPGQAHDLDGADALLPGVQAKILIADKSFDVDARVRERLERAGKTAVIPPRATRIDPCEYDEELYKERHHIENFFCRLKQFRAIATRYDKTARNFLAGIYLAASFIWLN
jgi:transposase